MYIRTLAPLSGHQATNQVASCSQKVSLAPKKNYPKNYKKKVCQTQGSNVRLKVRVSLTSELVRL